MIVTVVPPTPEAPEFHLAISAAEAAELAGILGSFTGGLSSSYFWTLTGAMNEAGINRHNYPRVRIVSAVDRDIVIRGITAVSA